MTRAAYEAKKQSLLAEIERVFGDIERDAEVVASVENLSPSSTSDKEQLLNAGNRWQDVPDQWIQENHLFLIYLDAPSFRFYLPAYLSWFLRFMDYEANYFSSSTFHSVLHILTIYERMAEFVLEKYSLLTPEQEKAIAHFLVFQGERFLFLYEQEEAQNSESKRRFRGYKGERGYKNACNRCQGILQAHWGQFLEGGFIQSDFPYPGPSRRWRELIATFKVIEPQKLAAYEAKKQALIAEIERAFDGVEREDGLTLHEAAAMEDYVTPEELAKARSHDTETRWQDVPDKSIQWGRMSLNLDEKGFHYYFPAYLTWYLRFIDNEEENFYSETFDSVDYALGIRFEVDLDEDQEAPIRQLESLLDISLDEGHDSIFSKFSAFSDDQKKAIAHFLHFKHEQRDYRVERWNLVPDPEDEEDDKADFARPHADIQRALDNYWGQFLEK